MKSDQYFTPIRLGIVLACIGSLFVAQSHCSAESDIQSLIKQLENVDARVSRDALKTLVEIGEPAVPELIKALDNERFRVRQLAVAALGKIKEPADVVLPVLLRMMNDKNHKVRWEAKFFQINIFVHNNAQN